MLKAILYFLFMLLITIAIQYSIKKFATSGRYNNIWTGTTPIIVLCVIGLFDSDPALFAGIIGYIVGDIIGQNVLQK